MEPELWQLLEDGEADDEIAAIIRLGQQAVFPPGVRVLTQFGGIITVRLRRSDIPRLNSAVEVAVMEAGDTYFAPDLEPHLETDAETLSLTPRSTDERRPPDQEATGHGVVIGVVDWGFDFVHPDFRNRDGTTRILALWDQRTSPKPGAPQPFGYGTLHDRDAINAALRESDPYKAMGYHPADADTGIGCHATHVASIAAGSGGPGRPMGVAPGADLIFVQNAPWGENTSEKLGDSVTLLEAIDFIFRLAGDRPCVINLSMGRHGEQHDGSTLIEQGLDAALRAVPGRAICMSNGNYFDKHIHASGQLRPSEERELVCLVNDRGPTYSEIEIWYSWRDRFAVEIRGPDEALVARIELGERVTLRSGGAEVGKGYHRAQEPNNLDNHIDIYLYKTAPAGSWTIRLIALDVVDGRWHAWIERDGLCPKCQARFRPQDAVPTYTTGTICNGLRTIAIGAFDKHDEERRVAHFSSAGPTRDGRLKPDVCAPGVSVLAARSAPRDPNADVPLTTRMSGTSMASPFGAGLVALMFEVAPRRLRIEETHNLLLQSAERVTVQDEVPDRLGIGYLDINAAVQAAREVPNRSLNPTAKSHGRTPDAATTLPASLVTTPLATDRPIAPPPAPPAAAEPPEPPAPPRMVPARKQQEAAAALTERTPQFGSGSSEESEVEILERPAVETAGGEYAENEPYACPSVLSPAGQARRAEDLRHGRNGRPQIVGGKVLCEGESHIVHGGIGGTTTDLLIWNFDIDGSYLKIQHEAALDQLIAAVHTALHGAVPSAASFSIHLSGFASRTGDATYNATLATEREDAVQAYLIANWEKFATSGEAPMAPLISFARNPGGFDPAAPARTESAQARSARIIAVPVGALIPPPRPFPKPCTTLTVWINAFIPQTVSGYTFTVPAGPHRGKTAIPCPEVALPVNWHCLSRGYLSDQRVFSASPTASVRMRSVAELQLAPPNFVRHPGAEHVTSGTTEIDKTSGAVTCAQAADMSRCSFSDFQVVPDVFLGNYTIKLKVKGAASDPCVNLAADIDYEGDISVFCSPRGNLVEVSFDGKIDAFPAFEMYARLNGVNAVLFKKPPPPGNTVTNLVFGANTPVSGRVRFEGCFLGRADRSTQEGAAENASEGIDPVGLLVGVTLASQLARPVPNQQAQPAPSLPDFGTLPGGSDATQRELADAEATREALPVDAIAPVEASRPNEYVDAESESAVAEAMPATMPAATPEAIPAAIPEVLPDAMTVDVDFAYEDVPQVQTLDPITPIHRIAAPATIYDAVISGRRPALLRQLGACCQLVAGPGEPLPTALLPGDVIVRRALGEAGVGHMFTVVDGTLLRSDELLRLLLRQEGPSDGWLVQVMEPARGRAAVDDLCRVALNAYRRVPFDQLVLRPFPPEQADSDAEGSPEGGGADIPCAADISPFGLTWRETDLKNHRNPRPQKIRGKLMCPGKADPPERSDPGGQTIKLLLWNFDIDGSYPKRQHETALDQLVVALHQALRTPVMAPAPASYTLYLSGFASQTGSVEHNTALATDRERAVERYLRDHIEDAGAIPETPIAPQVKFEFKSAGFDLKYPPRAEAPQARSVLIEAVPLGAPRPPPHRFTPRDPTRWLPLIKAATSPQGSVTQGNGVLGLIDGDETYRQMVADIRSATQPGHFIYLLGWAVIDDFPLIAGDRDSTLLKLLEAAVARGVQVRVLAWYDKLTTDQRNALLNLLGSLTLPVALAIVEGIIRPRFKGQNTEPIERISALKRVPPGDIEAAMDDATMLVSSHHQKVLVVNGSSGLLGYCGGVDVNPDRVRVTTAQAGSPLHDVHSRIVGPAAWDLMQTFIRRWDHFKGATDPKIIGRSATRPSPLAPNADVLKTLPGTCSVAIGRTFNPVRKGTSLRRERDVKSLFQCAVRNAARHIYIEDQYLVCMETAALLNAAIPRLESVIIVMPRSELSDFPCIWTYRKQFIERLFKGLSSADRNKVVVAVLRRPDGSEVHTYVHAKCWFVDDELAVIGSANIDRRGWESDSEVDAFIFEDAVPDAGQLTFAQKMRSLLWAEHLNVAATSVEDASAAAKLWRASPPGAMIATYDPGAGSDSSLYARFCPTLRAVVDPEAP